MRAKANKWHYTDPVELARRVDVASKPHEEDEGPVAGYSPSDTAWRQRVLRTIKKQPTQEEIWAHMQQEYQDGLKRVMEVHKAIARREKDGNVWDVEVAA